MHVLHWTFIEANIAALFDIIFLNGTPTFEIYCACGREGI
jgi:hypothetical protein